MKIGIIVGSTRPGRAGAPVGAWVKEQADQRSGDFEYELIDLAEFDLPLLSEPTVPGAADRQYENERTQAWSRKIDEMDGFVFVTPEYNHSVPAALKNAVDVIYPEWNNKAVAFVGYGASGAVRAVEHWRTIVANVFLSAVRAQLELSLFTDFGAEGFAPGERRAGELAGVFDQLEKMTALLAAQR